MYGRGNKYPSIREIESFPDISRDLLTQEYLLCAQQRLLQQGRWGRSSWTHALGAARLLVRIPWTTHPVTSLKANNTASYRLMLVCTRSWTRASHHQKTVVGPRR